MNQIWKKQLGQNESITPVALFTRAQITVLQWDDKLQFNEMIPYTPLTENLFLLFIRIIRSVKMITIENYNWHHFGGA